MLKGGPGSGNFGHAGIPGQRGGSAPSGGGGGKLVTRSEVQRAERAAEKLDEQVERAEHEVRAAEDSLMVDGYGSQKAKERRLAVAQKKLKELNEKYDKVGDLADNLADRFEEQTRQAQREESKLKGRKIVAQAKEAAKLIRRIKDPHTRGDAKFIFEEIKYQAAGNSPRNVKAARNNLSRLRRLVGMRPGKLQGRGKRRF